MHKTPALLILRTCVSVTAFMLCLTGAHAQNDHDARRLFQKGNAELNAGRLEAAIALYDSALSREHHEYIAYQKGLALRRAKRDAQAVAAFHDALSVNPNFAPAWNALGTGWLALGQPDSAVSSYEHALAINPRLRPARKGLASALVVKAQLLVDAGSYAAAIDVARQARTYDSSLHQIPLVIARAQNGLGKSADAIRSAQRALVMRPGSAAAAYEIGVAYRAMGDTVRSRASFSEAAKDPVFHERAEFELSTMQPMK